MQSAIQGIGGKRYFEGPIAQVLYAASGSSVDYADKLGALGFAFELRGGSFAPPASDILPGAQESYAGILAAINYAKGSNPTPTPPAPTPPTPPTPTPTPPSPTPTPPSPTPPSPTPPTPPT